jgi:hypothetical protein
MTSGNFKADPRSIIRAHRRTYVNAEGAPRWQDRLTFEGLPFVVLATCVICDVRLSTGASVGLLTVSGVMSVFLFTVVIQLWARAMDFAVERPEPGPVTSAEATSLEELTANAGYASFVCVLATVIFVITSISSGWALRISSAVGLGVGTHLVLVLMMVMKRIFLQTQERLGRARTGADLLGGPARR